MVDKWENDIKEVELKTEEKVKDETPVKIEEIKKDQKYILTYNDFDYTKFIGIINNSRIFAVKDLEEFNSNNISIDLPLYDLLNSETYKNINQEIELKLIKMNLNNVVIHKSNIIDLFKFMLVTPKFKKENELLHKLSTILNPGKDDHSCTIDQLITDYSNLEFGNKVDLYLLNRKVMWEFINTTKTQRDERIEKFFINNFAVKYYNIVSNLEDLLLEFDKNVVEDDVIKYTITGQDITFVIDNERFVIHVTDERYHSIKKELENNNKDGILSLIESKKKMEAEIKDQISKLSDNNEEEIKIEIIDKKILCNGAVFNGAQVDAFLSYMKDNNIEKIRMFKRFLYNLTLNPDVRAQKELYNFVIRNNLAITPMGTILLYKWVDGNLRDCHTHTFDNSPGRTVWMNRTQVDDNKDSHCSRGLHLCSFGYMKFGSRLLLTEMHPRDAVSVPTDYNFTKMRCCEYKVLLEITEYDTEFRRSKDILSKLKEIHYNPRLIEKQLMEAYPRVVRQNPYNEKLLGKNYEDAVKSRLFDMEIADSSDADFIRVESSGELESLSGEDIPVVIIEETKEVSKEETIEETKEVSKEETIEETKEVSKETSKETAKESNKFDINLIKNISENITKTEAMDYWKEINSNINLQNCKLYLAKPELFLAFLLGAVKFGFDHIIIQEAIAGTLQYDFKYDDFEKDLESGKINKDVLSRSKKFDVCFRIRTLHKEHTSVTHKEAEHTKNPAITDSTGTASVNTKDIENDSENLGFIGKVGKILGRFF